ncbi:alpha/beta fold hydrolase [Microbacterium sp. P05]|uniref:alpha/beta fold hydrolase n=1 Tax=Microbacterium sp. P05 TaxID=3366948 RepID=UPI003746F631
MPDFDEFSFLSAQADDAGLAVTIPRGERLTLDLPDGRTLSGLRYGGPSPEVTFLHGAGLNAHTWDTTILALGRPALALDLAGHGDSSWREDAAYVPRMLAPDVVTAITAWTDRPQLLVGQSLGGLTAAPVAAGAPAFVRRLAIVDITPGVDPTAGPSQVRAFFAGPTDWASRDELVERALSFGLGGGSRDKAARGVWLNSRVRSDGRVEWKHHFAHLAAASSNDPVAAASAPNDALSALLSEAGWEDFAAVEAPILLIRAERGYVTVADAEEFSRRLPAAEVTSVDSGHNVQEDAPVVLAGLLAGRL